MVCHRFLLNFFNDVSSQYEKEIINDYVTYTTNSGWIINFISCKNHIVKGFLDKQKQSIFNKNNHKNIFIFFCVLLSR